MRPGGLRGLARTGIAVERRRPRPLRAMRRRGWEEGVLGGDPKWLAAGVFAGSIWLVQWAWRKEAEVVYRTRLQPGETLLIEAAPKGAAKAAKGAKKAGHAST